MNPSKPTNVQLPSEIAGLRQDGGEGRKAKDSTGRRHLEALLWALLAALWLGVFTNAALDPDLVVRYRDVGSIGTLASGLIDGLASPPQNYQPNYLPGALVLGVLLCPVYAVFGSSLLWVMLLSMAFVSGAVVVWTLTIRHAWGSTAGLLFALFAILPPPFLDWIYHQPNAKHAESLFFFGLIAFLLVRAPTLTLSLRGRVLFGALAGLAIFFCEENALAVAAALIVAVWRWRRLGFWRLFFPALLGFLPAVAPLFWSPLLPIPVSGVSGGIHLSVFTMLRRLAVGAPGAWWNLLTDVLPRVANGWSPDIELRWVAWPLLAGLGVATALRGGGAAAAAKPEGKWLTRFLVVYFGCFFLAWGLTRFGGVEIAKLVHGNITHATSIMLPINAFAALFLARRTANWRWAVAVPMLFVAFSAGIGRHGFALAAAPGKLCGLYEMRGDSYLDYIYGFFDRGWRSPATAVAAIRRLPRRWRDVGWVKFGWWLGEPRADGDAPNAPEAAASFRREIAFGAGRALANPLCGGGPLGPGEARGAMDKNAAQQFAAGAGAQMFLTYCYSVPGSTELPVLFANLRRELPQLDDRDFALNFFRGLGVSFTEQPEDGRMELRPFTDAEIEREINLWKGIEGAPAATEEVDAFRLGSAEGLANRIINDFREFHFPPNSREFPIARAILETRGVRLAPRDDDPNEYVVKFVP